jgi:hypothetical protein
MNDTVKAIVAILDTGRPDLQVAAAQILGELRVKEPTVVKSLAASIARSHVQGRFALEALARVGTSDALRVLVRTLVEHDGFHDQLSHLLNEAGVAAHGPIAESIDQSPADRRLRLLQVLSRSLSKEVVPNFVRALSAPEVSSQTAKLILDASPRLPEPARKALRDGLMATLKETLADECMANVIGALAAVDAGGAKALLLHHASEKSSLPVRIAALSALRGQELTANQVKAFLQQLEDPAHQPAHDAIREALAGLSSWPEGLDEPLEKLLASRNQEQRLFALRALRTSGSEEAVRIALKLRDHADERFRVAAQEVLAVSKHAVDPLLRLLQLAREPMEAGELSSILVRLAPHITPKAGKAIAERAMKLLPQKPLIADHLADIALAALGEKLVPFLLDRAMRWRKQKRYPEALHVLARLAAKDMLDHEGRYQLAVTRLLQDALRPGAEAATPGNAAMGFFLGLMRDGFPLLDRIKKDNALPPEQQLKLGSYFAQTVGADRRFGQELLAHLSKRHKGRIGDEVKLAMRAAGG